jgi:hypothetical protein
MASKYQDTWHLADIQGHDVENLKQLLKKKVRTYTFKSIEEVKTFTMQAINTALAKHGISLQTAAEYGMKKGDLDQAGDAFQYLMDEKQVRIEERMDYQGEDAWKCGIYIYKDNEIADFLAAPRPISKTIILTNERFTVDTTVEL